MDKKDLPICCRIMTLEIYAECVDFFLNIKVDQVGHKSIGQPGTKTLNEILKELKKLNRPKSIAEYLEAKLRAQEAK